MNTRPLVLLGDARSPTNTRLFTAYGWGRMFVRNPPRPQPNEPWALDNGAYTAFRHNQPPNYNHWQTRLDQLPSPPPLFIVTPYLITAGDHSLIFSLRWLHHLKEAHPHLRFYLPIADHMTINRILLALPNFDGLFIAGSNTFKDRIATSLSIIRTHFPDLPMHYARASSPEHFQRAARYRCHSLDTAYPLRHPPALRPLIAAWIRYTYENTK